MQMKRWVVALLLALAAGNALAQTPGEIAFWESVRDSKNPAELRAYLQQFPNGVFKPLAEARVAGDIPPMDADFDLELVSYQLK